jgi:hypothetical protein
MALQELRQVRQLTQQEFPDGDVEIDQFEGVSSR